MVTLVRDGSASTTMAYARYLLSVRAGRWLTAGEEADHVDEDRLNDDPVNLQVLTPLDNKRKSARGRTLVTLTCPGCGQQFERERRQTHLAKGGKIPTACSRHCSGVAQHKRAA